MENDNTENTKLSANIEPIEDISYGTFDVQNTPIKPIVFDVEHSDFDSSLEDYHSISIQVDVKSKGSIGELITKGEESNSSQGLHTADPRDKIKTIEYSNTQDMQFLVQDYISFFPIATEIFGKGEFINHEEKDFSFKHITNAEIYNDVEFNTLINRSLSLIDTAVGQEVHSTVPAIPTAHSSGFVSDVNITLESGRLLRSLFGSNLQEDSSAALVVNVNQATAEEDATANIVAPELQDIRIRENTESSSTPPTTPATISGEDTGTVTEDTSTPMLMASGVLSVTDPDSGENAFIPENDVAGQYGSLSINADGQWSYAAENDQNAIQSLREGQSVTDTFIVNSMDGTEHSVVITLVGVNDPAAISGSDSGFVIEDSATNLTSSGLLTVDDVDSDESAFIPENNMNGTYGLLSIDAEGHWNYSAANNQTAVQALQAGQEITDSFTVRSVDGTTHDIVVTFVGVNDAPQLSDLAVSLNAVNEDAGAPVGMVGTLISDMVAGNVTDVDSASLGIAVIGSESTNGSWWYSTDNGNSWSNLGTVAESSARLLAADLETRIYFQPNANFNGTVTEGITYRAWDQTSGVNGDTVDITASGGASAFSSTTDTASIAVNLINDAPEGTDKTLNINEDSGYTFTISDFSFTDPNDNPDNSLFAVKITTLPTSGSLTLDGIAVSQGQSVSATDIAMNKLVFTPAANTSGNNYGNFTFQVQDNGGGSNLDLTPNTMTINVAAVNDAPVLDISKTPSFTSILEDTGSPVGAVGNLVSSLVDFNPPSGGLDNVTDVDTGALLGIAITAADTANGTWYYSTNGGTNWNSVGAVSDGSARLLAADASTRLYFQPNANYYGSSSITFRAWDRTSGTNGSTADTTFNGGSTAFSLNADVAGITITAVPDALFTTGNDIVDFNTLLPSDYILTYDALAGNDVVTLPNTPAKIAEWGYNTAISFTGGAGDDTIIGSNVGLTISGGANDVVGDTISYANVTGAGVNANLNTDTTTGLSGSSKTGTDTLANFEHVTGSSFADILVGSGAANTLIGGGGNDSLEGRGGADTYAFNLASTLGTDTINDSGGTDVIDFSQTTDSSKNATINLSQSSLQTVLASTLSLIISVADSIENVIGGAGNDVITGTSGGNTLVGGSGADTLEGLAGGDTLEGGLGDDTYKFDITTNLGTDRIIETDTTLGGIDTLDFSMNTGVININLDAATETTANIAFGSFAAAAPNIENIYGGSNNDSLTGNALDNILQGNAGNDILTGMGGNDILIGGLGDDTYVFNVDSDLGVDTITETDTTLGGLDTLDFSGSGASNNIRLNLDLANEFTNHIAFANLAAFAPNIENIFGGAGNDELTGNALANILRGNAGADTLVGMSGNDTLEGGAGNDVLTGGTGNDTYVFTLTSDVGTDTINESNTTAGGIDTFDFSASSISIKIDLSGVVIPLVENSTNIAFSDTSFKDHIENILGGSGGDTLIGNSLDNFLQGNAGTDTLIGNAGNDSLEGNAGNDRLEGGVGNDTYVYNLTGSALGTDTIIEINGTTDGIDTLDFSNSSIVINVNLNTATESTADIAFTSFNAAAPNIENLYGGSMNDILTGNAAGNYIKGGSGIDTISGLSGADTLESGVGADTLTGGSESDVFKYNALSELGDIITDFTHNADIFKLDSSVFSGGSPGATLDLSGFESSTGSSASSSGVYFVFNTANGQLFYDADSSGGGAGVMIADTQLSGVGSLTNNDIQFF